jgi:hypothetical protein
MIKRLAAFLLLFNFAASHAQTIKTDVLVIGGSPAGVAAAIQCARSKVKTVLVEQGSRLCPRLLSNKLNTVAEDGNYPGGIWDDFRQHLVKNYRPLTDHDTVFVAPVIFQSATAATILSVMTDSVKNLTIQLNTSFVKIVKDDDRWDVSLTSNGNRQNIKARVVIDATPDGAIMLAAGGKQNITLQNFNYRDNLYRTSVSTGDIAPIIKSDFISSPSVEYPPAYYLPMKSLLAKRVDNLLVLGLQWPEIDAFPEALIARYLRADLSLGQGAGVIAAYCAFYKTTTANLNVRIIQGELLDFKGDLLPIDDIVHDPYWRAIQQISATGMLKPVVKRKDKDSKVLFVPDSIVTTAEIKPVMLEIYTRAFLWFNKEKPAAQFTVGNLLSFISELTLTDQDNLQKTISKDWTEKYKFTSTFDPDKPITRREFAILANKYLNPFGRTVDLDGRVVN